MEFVITEGRTEIARRVHDLTQEILDRYETGLEITSVNMQDAQPPEPVQAAFDDAVKAREDNVRLKNEAEAYANDIIPKAQGRAARDIAEANGYKEQVIAEAQGETARFLNLLSEYKKAPEVTRKRLYLETVESVMVNSSKIMVDVKGGNNLLYLPLDRLIDQRIPITIQQAPRSTETAPTMNQSTEPRRREVIRRGER
jgi:membrane protease subunit HflK